MKKKILSLGSALVLLATTLQAQDEMSFGLKGGGSFIQPAIGEATIKGQDYDGKWKIFVGGGAFLEYRLLEDMMSVGLEVGYAKRGIELTEKKKSNNNSNSADNNDADNKNDDKKAKNDYCLDIHALDITMPIAYLPMEREGGLSLFAGPKLYIPLSTKEKRIDDKDSKKADEGLVNSFNFGVAGGAKYEIAESGFFVGAHYEYFFWDILGDDDKAKALKKDFGKKEKDKFNTHGAQAFVGFDFARLLVD